MRNLQNLHKGGTKLRMFVLGVILICGIILQLTVFNFIKVAGVKPDLILIIIIFNALLNGSKDGAVLGLIGGLLQDLLTGQFIGLNALSKAATGYIFGFAGRKLYKENIIIPILSLLVGSLINDAIFYFLASFINLGIPFIKAIQSKMIPAAIYNCCLSPFIYGKFYDSSARGLLSKVDQ